MLVELYVLLRGMRAAEIFRSGVSAVQAAQAFRAQNARMKAAVQALLTDGVPLRRVLIPYIDTVLMDARTPDYFMGGRILLCGVSNAQADACRRIAAQHSLRVYTAVCDDTLRKQLQLRMEPAVSTRSRICADVGGAAPACAALVGYFFPAGRMTEPEPNPMHRRACSRAVLALGDMLGRTVRSAGGEILCCAEDALVCAWPQAEPDGMAAALQQTFARHCAPLIGGPAQMKRVCYSPAM